MDPTQTLTDIRDLTRQVQIKEVPSDDVGELIGRVEDLDNWMTNGGFPPEQWRNNKRGRPRETRDGPKLAGVVHGSRNSYNKGCHCMLCRAANAEWARTQRKRAKERAMEELL